MNRVIRLIALVLFVINVISLISFIVGIYEPSRFEIGITLLDDAIALLVIAMYATDVKDAKAPKRPQDCGCLRRYEDDDYTA